MSPHGLWVILVMGLLLAACQQLPAQRTTEIAVPVIHVSPGETIQPTQTPLASPSPTPAPSLTPSASPTPLYEMDLSRFDPDIFPPIDVAHMPPLIAQSDDLVSIVFNLVNAFCIKLPVSCLPEGVLYYTYGKEGVFQSMALSEEIVDEMDSLVARLPAADAERKALRYYAEFLVAEAGYTQRYPGAGTIDLFAAEDFIPVELPVENPVQPGDQVFDFFWGYGPDKALQATYEHYPQRVGPPAMDVADDGRMAIMDPVNERIIIFNTGDSSYSSFALPFPYGFNADLAFGAQGRMMVCDYQGEEEPGKHGQPDCYLLATDGKLLASTPAYVMVPAGISKDLKILDYGDSRLVVPFDSQGKANSREAQRDKTTWDLAKRYVEGQYPYLAHYADVLRGVAFEVHSLSPLGVLMDFVRTPRGYLLTFSLGDRMRAVWSDEAGAVLKDVTLPKGDYSEVNFNGQTAVSKDGSLYVMGSTKRGIEIHFVEAP